jgi:hypothetical protein
MNAYIEFIHHRPLTYRISQYWVQCTSRTRPANRKSNVVTQESTTRFYVNAGTRLRWFCRRIQPIRNSTVIHARSNKNKLRARSGSFPCDYIAPILTNSTLWYKGHKSKKKVKQSLYPPWRRLGGRGGIAPTHSRPRH